MSKSFGIRHDALTAVKVRQMRPSGAPVGGEALPDNRQGRRIMAKLEKKAQAQVRNKARKP